MNIYQVEKVSRNTKGIFVITIYIGFDYNKAKQIANESNLENISVYIYTWAEGDSSYMDVELV